jgi:hypothetical protein
VTRACVGPANLTPGGAGLRLAARFGPANLTPGGAGLRLAARFGRLALALAAPWVALADPYFEIREVASPDRVLQADLADLDGDGRGDLLWISSRGIPPDEERELRVHLAGADGVPSASFSWRAELPAGASSYDLAELDGRPGTELLLLRRDRVTSFSLSGGTPSLRDLPVPGGPTLAAVLDERGIDRLRLLRDVPGAGPRLLVPGFGTLWVLEPDGRFVAQLEVGGRANFLTPPRPGPILTESEIEIYFDHPRISVGDVDGDGRADIVAANRHELRVFRQRPDASFATAPDLRLPLRLLSLADHIRTSGSVRVEPHDFDGDGRLDLLVSNASGSVFGGDTHLRIHLNRGGTWNLAAADQSFERTGGISVHEIVDLDGDGRHELVVALIPTGVLELVEMLLTRSIDAEVAVYRPAKKQTPFDPAPWQRWKSGIGFDFDTLRTRGFVPTLATDLNADGHRDLLDPGDGVRLEVRLGDPVEGFRTVHATQSFDTGGRIRFGDLGSDGLHDFVLYDPRRPGSPIRIGRNLGGWPVVGGTPALREAPAGK